MTVEETAVETTLSASTSSDLHHHDFKVSPSAFKFEEKKNRKFFDNFQLLDQVHVHLSWCEWGEGGVILYSDLVKAYHSPEHPLTYI